MSVTVYIPVRNRAATVEAAVVSACRQNPAEVVVLDDASTDGSTEIVERLAAQYPQLRLISYAAKAPDWQKAAASHFASFVGTHVIGLGADDELCDGMVDVVDMSPNAPIVFSEYHVRKPGGDILGSVVHGYDRPTSLTPADVRARLASDCYPHETGIGSAIRSDLLRFLCELRFWLMGPWSDAIGYTAVAALHGAVYVPGAGAIFTEDDGGYGAIEREGKNTLDYQAETWRFLAASEVDSYTAKRILWKRGISG